MPQVGVRGIGGGRLDRGWRKSRERQLFRWLEKGVANCRVGTSGRGPISLSLDATGVEIVDVVVRGRVVAAVKACIEERAWDLLLDLSFDRDTAYNVTFP